MNEPVENPGNHSESNSGFSELKADATLSESADPNSAELSMQLGRLRADAMAAETSRIEIEQTLSRLQQDTASLAQQLESAKLLIEQINTLHGNLQTNSTLADSLKNQATEAFQLLQTTLAATQEKANQVETIRLTAEQSQSEIATKSAFIEDGRAHAERTRTEIERQFAEARQLTGKTEEQHQASRTILDSLNAIQTSAQTAKIHTDANAESVTQLLQQCRDHAATTKKLADIAEATERKVNAYEQRLADLEKMAAERLMTIESLLPSAASAGLASAFNQRRMHFTWPQRVWQGVFVCCVLALIAIAALEFGFFAKASEDVTWDKLGLSLLHRLPYALPLIWLAVHASGKAAMAQRVEEDYAFKETVSRSFEGFRREMAELEGKAAPDSALSRLCSGVLTIITNPPGRIYETLPLNQTPLKLVVDSAGPIANAASKLTTATVKIE